MIGDHIQEKISNWDILIYPYISIYILVYIHARFPYLNLPKWSNKYPVLPLLSKFHTQDPSLISRKYIPYDIQLWYPNFIQVYPFVSNNDIYFRYPWCYPIWVSCSSNCYPFISQQLSFHMTITVILSYLVIYPLLPIKG